MGINARSGGSPTGPGAGGMGAPGPHVLDIQRLSVRFAARRGGVHALSDVSLAVAPGEKLGIIGESGCGKSTLLNAVLRLLPPAGQITSGSVRLAGRDLLALSPRAMRELRGRDMAMIFQDPMTALNPVYRVGEQVREALRVHRIFGRGHAARRQERAHVLGLLTSVGIPAPAERYHDYPHQFSGGMQQRAIIAAALACGPKVLLADEPTTALDVTVQAQILNLLEQINRERNTAILLVSHDIRLAGEFCDRIAVMYAGRVVEVGPARDVIRRPRHPYTAALLRSLPRLEGERGKLEPIGGYPPDLAHPQPGCAFAPRCPRAEAACADGVPPDVTVGPGHAAACLFAAETGPREVSS